MTLCRTTSAAATPGEDRESGHESDDAHGLIPSDTVGYPRVAARLRFSATPCLDGRAVEIVGAFAGEDQRGMIIPNGGSGCGFAHTFPWA